MNLLEKYFGQYKDVFGGTTPTTSSGSADGRRQRRVGQEGGSALVFTVTRSGDLSKTSVGKLCDGERHGDRWFGLYAVQGTLNFAAGQATATVTVQVTNDTLVESAETLKLNLTGGTNVSVADGSGTGTINSEDGATVTRHANRFPDGSDHLGHRRQRQHQREVRPLSTIVNAKGGNDTSPVSGARITSTAV
jgi:hypothetical protein